MSHAHDLPSWAAVLTALLVLIGAGLTLAGAIGTLRFGSFYERVHAPTLGTSWGNGAIALASMIFFSAIGSRPVVHEVLIAIFITVTTPVTLMLLARAALYRDRTEESGDVPAKSAVRRSARSRATRACGGTDSALPPREDCGQRRRPARPVAEPICDIDVAAWTFACLSCLGLRTSRLPFLLAMSSSPTSMHEVAPTLVARSCVRMMLLVSPGLAGAARAARASGPSWDASGTTRGLRRTCSLPIYGDYSAKLQGQPTDTPRFASKGRTFLDPIESPLRKPHLKSMFTPGHIKKYLVVSASLLTRS